MAENISMQEEPEIDNLALEGATFVLNEKQLEELLDRLHHQRKFTPVPVRMGPMIGAILIANFITYAAIFFFALLNGWIR